MSFLKNPTSEEKAILVIDASGSVNNPYGSQMKIFDKFELICQQLPHQEYHVVFWNSDLTERSFKNGIMKFPFTVTPDKLSTVFKIARDKINGGCLTMPHLGFQAIHDWLDNNYSATIHFLTDGEIGWPAIRRSTYTGLGEMRKLKDGLVAQIKQIISKHRDVQLCIHAVENKTANFGSTETLNTSAGNDVYRLISENRLTSMVSKFISYTINHPDGYSHISKVKTPIGFVPYGDQYFSMIDTNQFLAYIYDTIITNKDNEDELLKIVQRLSYTLNVLITDKPLNIRSNMIKMFCDMFSETCIDAVMINFLLTQSIESESAGSASLFAEYRANLKNLYQNANRLLHDDAKSALGITDQVITLPLPLNDNQEECVIVSDHHVPDQTVMGFQNGGFLLNNKLIPALPAQPQISGTISEQCLRQWVRALISKQYNVHVTADEIIYLVMMINLRVQFSFPNQPEVCQAYRKLVTVMLRKKRLNTNTTELARIEEGHLPIPNNGRIENFNRYMSLVAVRLGLNDFEPLRMWYYLCLAHSDKLADVQYVHVKDLLSGEKPKIEDLNLRPLQLWKLPTQLEYQCLISLESTRESGGYRFLDHQNMMGQSCRPRQVLSLEGYQGLLSNPDTSRCPICYTGLTETDFAWIDPPAPEADQFPFEQLNTDQFKNPVQSSRSNNSSNNSSSNNRSYNNQGLTNVTKASHHRGTLIVLCGTVGCGKTTYANQLKELAEADGYHCEIEGADKYCMTGSSIQHAVGQASAALARLQSLDHPKKMVIVDACNERFDENSLFGVNYSNWNIKRVYVNLERQRLQDYLSWSLRNVINRQGNEAVLTPDKAGLQVCIDVHAKKAKGHFGKKKGKTPLTDRSRAHTKEQVLEQINAMADRYQKFLEDNAQRFAVRLPN